jgi:hypothetical protein
MHEEFKKALAGTNMVEEDIEFFAMSLVALLKQQQSIKHIPEQIFRKKFTTLFRLYEPLLQQLYDRPALLIRTFLLWENNFFAKVPKLHHRDEAREKNMDLIISLIDTDLDEVEDTVQVTADERLEKIEQQRIKSEEIKERKRAKGKQAAKKKPKLTFEMNEEQGDAEKSALTHILGYMKELDSAIIEAEAAIHARGQGPAKRLEDEQKSTKQYVQRLVADTSTVLGKARTAGIKPEDMDVRAEVSDVDADTAAAGPALPTLPAEFASSDAERSFWRTAPVLRNLAILQSQCRLIESSACYESLRASRFAVAVLHAERQRLRETRPANAVEAEQYIAQLTEWDANTIQEEEGLNEEYNLIAEERLTIERKAKFAKYIESIKTKNLRLDGDLDEQFQVKAKFQPVVDKAKAAAAAQAAADSTSNREADDTRAELLQRGKMQRGHDDDGSDDGE